MNRLLPLLLLGIALSASAEQASPLPDDFTAFVEDYELCLHFSGEEPYDEERRAFLNAQLERYCSTLEAQRAALQQRYASNPGLLQRLQQYPPL